MNLELEDVEVQIRETTRQFCRSEFSRESIRSMTDNSERPSSGLWKVLADQGWFSLRTSEDEGGAGLGPVASWVLFFEVGRALVPGPVLWSHLSASLLGAHSWMAAVREGRAIVSGAYQSGAGPVLIEDLDLADLILLVDDGHASLIEAKGVDARSRTSLDPTRTLSEITSVRGAEVVGDADMAFRLISEGRLLVAAMAAGGAAAARDIAVQYAKDRRQFGRPIGSFQAVKHLCADMAVRAHGAESISMWAALQCQTSGVEVGSRFVDQATVVTSAACLDNARSLIQVLGAMGYTWEHEAHLYLKRAHGSSVAFGGAIAAADRVGQRLVTNRNVR